VAPATPELALTFLTPLAGIIAASITIPALLLFYFLKLRRRPLRVSSTMLWEQAVQDLQVNAPFRMIRFSWLLLIQLLALACLILAAARPALDLPSLGSGRLILLIDRSASMSAEDVGPEASPRTRLEEAKRRAIELLDRAHGSGARVMVVAFSSNARTVMNFSRDQGAVRTAIEGIDWLAERESSESPEDHSATAESDEQAEYLVPIESITEVPTPTE